MLQPKGSLTETDLRSLLESAQAERATGTLTVRDGNGHSATFYFLFGHLFHALADGKTGDDAVVGALGWPGGEFDFDPKAKLPADETVRSSIPDLIQNAGSSPARQAPPAPASSIPMAMPSMGSAPASEGNSSQPVQAGPGPAERPTPPSPPSPAPGWAAPAIQAAKPNQEPPRPAASEPPQPRRGVKHRPEPKGGAEPVPVPSGQVIYDSLKTSFVDFPRLITTLEREGYTGYVKLLTEDASGLIFFRDGSALECVFHRDQDQPRLGTPALRSFHEEVTHGHGVLDVVGLNADLIAGLYDLTVATPIYSDLYASWVDASALLNFLKDGGLSGSLMVRAAGGVGVVILSGGRLAGAYTTDAKDVNDSADVVLALCKDPAAVIEVKANEGRPRDKLDVDAVIGSNRTLEADATPLPVPVAAAPTPAPAPPAPAPAASAVPAEPPTPAAAPAPAITIPATIPPTAATPAPEVNAWDSVPAPAPAAASPVSPPQQPGADTTQNLPAAPATPIPTAPQPAAAAPVTQTLPMEPAPPPAEPAPAAGRVAAPARVPPNWDTVIADLQATTEEALGNRSRKVKDVLASAERSQAGIESAISQIPTISILFVDSSRLEALAGDLRAKLNSYLA